MRSRANVISSRRAPETIATGPLAARARTHVGCTLEDDQLRLGSAHVKGSLGLGERFDLGRGGRAARVDEHRANRADIVEAEVALDILLVGERNPQRGQYVAKGIAMDELVVDENTVEVENGRREHWFSGLTTRSHVDRQNRFFFRHRLDALDSLDGVKGHHATSDSKSTLDADVVIVGGGPAGLATGIFLCHADKSRIGRVVVLEKETYPRDKFCAGGIGARADHLLATIGVVVDVPSVPIDGASLKLKNGTVCVREERSAGWFGGSNSITSSLASRAIVACRFAKGPRLPACRSSATVWW